MHGQAVKWANGFFDSIAPGVRIAVHLKQDAADKGKSNANAAAWHSFLSRAAQDEKVTFVLIGDDKVDPQILALPNVIRAADQAGATLAGHLAVIQESNAFMGMMSGPCNLALFGSKPYTIYKNPEHHQAEMLAEIGAADGYPFAHSDQRVLRAHETTDLLWAEFHRLTAALRAAVRTQ